MEHIEAGPAHAWCNKTRCRAPDTWFSTRQHTRARIITTRFVAALAFLAVLLSGSWFMLPAQSDAYAAHQRTNGTCTSYTIRRGDTLNSIARRHHTTAKSLASINHIPNINRISAGHRLCTANGTGQQASGTSKGLLANGTVRWHAYDALEKSSRDQVVGLLRQAAATYGLPANLLLAIAWQESGWRQHVIARDGGIGTMQIMPATAAGLNVQARARYDPYKLADNITLGAIYLRTLWNGFHGDITKVISAYNQGGWNVIHRGIYNWSYVRSVQALMRRF